MPRANPRYAAPYHLDPLVQLLQRAWTESVRCAAHAPPRHAKTESILLFIALTLLLYPEKTCGYVTYGAELAASKSRKVRAWFKEQGGQLAPDAKSVLQWCTTAGGGLVANGIEGPWTGRGVDFLFVDDPYKSRVQAESPAYQHMVIDWWGDVANTRVEPGGSIFIFHTRWTTADLIGHVLDGEDKALWTWLQLAAIAEDDRYGRVPGTALWPDRWPIDALLAKKRAVGPYTWASLFQGRPQPRGGSIFGEPRFYERVPDGARYAIGIDLAYSGKTKSDYSVAVVVAEKDGVYYLVDVVRLQVPAPAFAERLQLLRQQYIGAPMRWIASGTEAGAAQFLQAQGLPLTVETASTDKFVRSIDAAAAWNGDRVLLPREQKLWLPELLDEFAAFTGVSDVHDDQVDALAAAMRAIGTSLSLSGLAKYKARLPGRSI